MEYKYLIQFDIPEPFASHLRKLMDRVAKITRKPAPYLKLPPHMTFHGPITSLDEQTVLNVVAAAALQMRQTRVRVSGWDEFEKSFMVLPVTATLRVAALWYAIYSLLSRLPGYSHDEYSENYTLHTTIAQEVSDVFEEAWPRVQRIKFDPMDIPLHEIAVYRKLVQGGQWEKIRTFPIPA